MVEAFNGVHLRPMLESVMSTKLRSVSWGTSNELKSGRERQRHREAKERQGREKQCSSLSTLTAHGKQLRWYAEFLWGFRGKGGFLVVWFLAFFIVFFGVFFLFILYPAVQPPAAPADRTWNPNHLKTVHFPLRHTIFRKTYKGHLTGNKFTSSNDEPQRLITFQWKQKKHTQILWRTKESLLTYK